MSSWTKLVGTTESTFQVGLGGPKVKNSSGVVEARNAADDAYAIIRGATPSGANDLATKTYTDALSVPSADETTEGKARQATAAEVNASTAGNFFVRPATLLKATANGVASLDADGLVPANQLEDTLIRKHVFAHRFFGSAEAFVVGDGAGEDFIVPEALNAYSLSDIELALDDPGTVTGASVQLYNIDAAVDMLLVNVQTDATERYSGTATTQPSIDSVNRQVLSGERLRIDVDAAPTSGLGGVVILTFQKLPTFSPLEIANCDGWYSVRFTDGYTGTIGGTLSVWKDRANGLASTFTSFGGDASFPASIFGSYPGIYLGTGGAYKGLSAPPASFSRAAGAGTCIIVGQPIASSGTVGSFLVIQNGTASEQLRLRWRDTSTTRLGVREVVNITARDITNGALTLGTNIVATFSTTGSGNHKIRKNKVEQSISGSVLGSWFGDIPTDGTLKLYNESWTSHLYIAELITYSRDLTDGEKLQVENMLMTEYAI